jgi:hypothetical protein
MGNTSGGYLGSVGRGGTSNQTNASFQIGRARRSFRSQANELGPQAPTNLYPAATQQSFSQTNAEREGLRRSMEALQDYEDTPYGPALTREAAVRRTGGNRLMGNRANDTLIDRAELRPGYRRPRTMLEGLSNSLMVRSGRRMTAEQARTGGDRYIQMRFNEPNYRSR